MKTNEVIRELRHSKNWSQEQMAAALNMAKNTYARLERGERKLDAETAKMIASIFQIDISQLLHSDKKVIKIEQKIVVQDIGNNTENENSTVDTDKNVGSKVRSDGAELVELTALKTEIAGLKALLAEKEKRIEGLERELAGANKVIAILEKNQSE